MFSQFSAVSKTGWKSEMAADPLANRRPTGLCKPYRLSADLRNIVGVDVASYAQLNRLIWAYIKRHNLQDRRDKRYFYPDQKLTRICGLGRLKQARIFRYMRHHMRPV